MPSKVRRTAGHKEPKKGYAKECELYSQSGGCYLKGNQKTDSVIQISSNEKKNIVSRKSWQKKKLTFIEHLMYKGIMLDALGLLYYLVRTFQGLTFPVTVLREDG